MLNSRISLHMALMFLLAGLHLVLLLLVGFQIAVDKTMESSKCGSLHFATRLLYLALNLVMLLYVFNLARKAKIQSMDIYIFDLQIKIVKILIPVASSLCLAYFLTNHVCLTMNLVDEVSVVRDGAVVDTWAVAARGRNS